MWCLVILQYIRTIDRHRISSFFTIKCKQPYLVWLFGNRVWLRMGVDAGASSCKDTFFQFPSQLWNVAFRILANFNSSRTPILGVIVQTVEQTLNQSPVKQKINVDWRHERKEDIKLEEFLWTSFRITLGWLAMHKSGSVLKGGNFTLHLKQWQDSCKQAAGTGLGLLKVKENETLYYSEILIERILLKLSQQIFNLFPYPVVHLVNSCKWGSASFKGFPCKT